MQPGDQAQHAQHEQDAGEVEAAHQPCQAQERLGPVAPDREGHRAQGPERGEAHDVADDDEQHLPETLDQPVDRVRAAAARVQCEPEEHREQQRLQHVPAGEGAEEGRRDDVEDEFGDPGHGRRGDVLADGVHVQRGRVRVHSRPWLHHIHHDQPDDEGNGGEEFKVDQRQPTGLA